VSVVRFSRSPIPRSPEDLAAVLAAVLVLTCFARKNQLPATKIPVTVPDPIGTSAVT
jgi:hypothetical protein